MRYATELLTYPKKHKHKHISLFSRAQYSVALTLNMSSSRFKYNHNTDDMNEQSNDSDEEVTDLEARASKQTRVCIVFFVSCFILISLIYAGGVLHSPDMGSYPDNEEILNSLQQISSSLSGVVNSSLLTIGHSVEGHPIKLLRISSESSGPRAPLVWVVCGMHAREWTSPLACLHIVKNIRDIKLSRSPHSENLILNKFRYNFLVMGNPDGYIYSMGNMSDLSRRMTRKNRAKIGCPNSDNDGVDLNRNFGTGFNHGDDCYGVPDCPYDSSPCSITFGGPEPFSEPETRAVRQAMTAEVPWLSISLHGNGNVWSAPYASKVNTTTYVDNLSDCPQSRSGRSQKCIYLHTCICTSR